MQFVRALRSRFLRRLPSASSSPSPSPREEDITACAEGSMFFVDRQRRAVLLAVTLLPPALTPAYVLALAVAQMLQLGESPTRIKMDHRIFDPRNESDL